jgi:dTDP-glucose pyrophosphorylase
MGTKGSVEVDITTGRPLELVQAEQANTEKAKKESLLKERMEFLNLSQTADGKKLLALVERKLLDRIGDLVKADPEAQAYTKILKDLGIKEVLAEQAAKEYLSQYSIERQK